MTPRTERSGASAGVLYTFGAYLLWGFLPLYFLLLEPASAWEVVASRILFSLVFCALLIVVTRGAWPRLRAILREPRLVLLTGLAGLLIYVNWQVFVLGALSGNIIETSLGYFINPIFVMLLGVVVLHERLRPLQWAAVGLASIAVVVIVVAYGKVPWIALGLALSFGTYGLVKSKIGPRVDAVSGLALETAWLVPVAVVQLGIVAATTGITFGAAGLSHALLLAGTGVITAVPLLLFAAGTRRIPLTVVGMLQFLTPIMQFLIGLSREHMPPERWAGFVIVWIAVAVFVVDSLIAARRSRAA